MPQFLTGVNVCRMCLEEKQRARYQFAVGRWCLLLAEGNRGAAMGDYAITSWHVTIGGSSTWRPTRPQLEELFGNHHGHNYPKFRYLEQSGSRSSGYFVNTYIIGPDVAGALVTVAL